MPRRTDRREKEARQRRKLKRLAAAQARREARRRRVALVLKVLLFGGFLVVMALWHQSIRFLYYDHNLFKHRIPGFASLLHISIISGEPYHRWMMWVRNWLWMIAIPGLATILFRLLKSRVALTNKQAMIFYGLMLATTFFAGRQLVTGFLWLTSINTYQASQQPAVMPGMEPGMQPERPPFTWPDWPSWMQVTDSQAVAPFYEGAGPDSVIPWAAWRTQLIACGVLFLAAYLVALAMLIAIRLIPPREPPRVGRQECLPHQIGLGIGGAIISFAIGIGLTAFTISRCYAHGWLSVAPGPVWWPPM